MRLRRTVLALILAGGCARVAAPALPDATPPPPRIEPFCQRRLTDPPRTLVERPCGTLAGVLTDGARTAVMDGPERTFSEATAAAPVITTSWVRVLPAPFNGTIDPATELFLDRATRDRSPDIFGMAMQYLEGAPALFDQNRMQIAGDADYGPITDLGVRLEGADFNDYLGIDWSFAGSLRRPRGEMFRSLDCSGFMRMIWGFRSGVPLAGGPSNEALPRRAVQMEASSFGVPISLQLQAGDLVFFDADPDDGPAVDHVGMVLGPDTAGHLRFVSSRKNANGPTLGDLHGASILDGTGLYAKSYRSARRL